MIIPEDIMLLLSQGMESQELEMIITNAKKKYVDEHHHYAISHMTNSTGYKKDKWKSYIKENGKRKEVIRNTEKELYAVLYEHYYALDKRPKNLEDVFSLLKEYKRDCLARSVKTIREDIRRFEMLDESLKKKPLASVSDEDIRKWLVKKFLPTRPSESSLRKQIQLISQIFEYGIRNKYCFDNPTRYISANDYLNKCDNSEKLDEEKAFSQEEIQKIREDCLKDTANPRALMTLVAIETGERAGELSAMLKADDKYEYLHVHRQQIKEAEKGKKQQIYDVTYTKDERFRPHNGRLIPITPECRNALELAKALPGESKYLFHDENGDPITRDSYVQNLRRRCNKLKTGPTHNHAFRVAFNSRLIELGFNAADRALILGHEVQTNEAHYSVTDKRHLEDLRMRLNGEPAKPEISVNNTI